VGASTEAGPERGERWEESHVSEPQQQAAADDRVSADGLAGSGPAAAVGEGPARTATGHPEVDEAIDTLDALDGLPVADHAAVFEAAHARLRHALTDAGNAPA
jgi:hypothetical protein